MPSAALRGEARSSSSSPEPPSELYHVESLAFQLCKRFLPGWGLVAAGIPGASLITSAVLILGIIQIGPSIVIVPIVIWSWIAMDPTTARPNHDLFDPGQSARQHSSSACHGAGSGHSDADHFDRSPGRYCFLRDHRSS